MPSFGQVSSSKLETCHPDLIRLFQEVVKEFDCTILEGSRTLERQKKLFAAGKSQTMNSNHLKTPSTAVDVAPFPVHWSDTKRFYLFAGFVLGTANRMKIKIRWGGDWDQDTQVKDNTFNDLVHFELIRADSS